MKNKIRLFTFLTTACFLAAGLVAPLAKAGTIVVGAPVAATADNVARHLARNLGANYIVLNKSGFDAASAAREMRGKATDGSELMIVQMNESGAAEGKSPQASEFAGLTAVAMLGDIQTPTGKLWFGLFAPPGTPPSVVSSLNARVRQLMASVPSIRTTSTVQYAQDMSPSALSERLAAASRVQAASPSAPAAPSTSAVGAVSRLGADSEQECLAEFRAIGTEFPGQFRQEILNMYRQRHGTGMDQVYEGRINYHYQNDTYGRWSPGVRINDPVWLKGELQWLIQRRPEKEIKTEITWLICKTEARIARLSGRSTTTARIDPPSGRPTPPTPAPSATPSVSPARPPSSSSTGTAPSTHEAIESVQAQARQRQATLDEQRRGKPKRHYADREAHRCLKLWTEVTIAGGFINTCDFPVTFVYCAYKPKKGAWTESFNCEGKTPHVGGNATIQPHDRSSHHTLGAQKILWFACRSDSTKEEIFEVGDGEFDPSGPFIRARCVKWGDRS